MESGQLHDQRLPDGTELRGDDGEDGNVNTIELVEAAPRSALTQAREDLTHSLSENVQRDSKFTNHA